MWGRTIIIPLLLAGLSTSHFLPCESDNDCSVEGTSCQNKNCDCTKLSETLSESFTKCLEEATEFDGACEETVQCQILQSGFQCVDQKCKCLEGLTYFMGKCRKLSQLHESCNDNLDCYGSHDIEATVCKNNKCECADSYYERPGFYCRRKSTLLRNKCVVNDDCADIPGAICYRQLCTTSTQKSSLTTKVVADEINNYRNLTSATKFTGRSLGNPCTTNSDCGLNAICSPKKGCVCNFGYYADPTGTICFAELGQKCENYDVGKSNCEGTRKECRDGVCSCEDNSFVNFNLRTCEKPSDFPGSCATFDIRCFAFGPGSTCVEKKCTCHEGSPYDEEDNNCLIIRGAGEKCMSDKDCGIGKNDLTCEEDQNGSKTCSCKEGFQVSADGTKCLGDNPGFGESCVTHCKSSTMECTSNEICECKPYHEEINNDCIPGILSTCSTKADCPYNNGDCILEKCDCQEGYVANGIEACIKKAEFGEVCFSPIQCQSMLGDLSNCIEGRCECLEDIAHYGNGKCWERKVIGEACTRSSDCYVTKNKELVMCRNSFCTCDYGYSPDSTNGECVKSDVSSMTGSIFTITMTLLVLLLVNALINK